MVEVVNWATAAADNQAIHPTGPRGERAPQISRSIQELQAAIARWRDGALQTALDSKIGATGVTYENLNANGDVGTGAEQVAAGDHGHAQLHNQSHAITSTSDHTATNWRVFHSNDSGQVVEIALGAAGTLLTSNGASSAPSFQAVAVPTGMIASFAGPAAPTAWLKCDGAAVSRTTYADLFAYMVISQSGTRTSSSAVITGLTDTSDMQVGDPVGGTGIPASTTILTVDSGTQITLSANATSSGTDTVDVGAWGIGDGSTTFNVPDYRGEGFRGWDDGRGVDTGRRRGSHQEHAVEEHSHRNPATSGYNGTNANENYLSKGGTGFSSTLAHTGPIWVNANASNPNVKVDANETRMRNQAALVCIKT